MTTESEVSGDDEEEDGAEKQVGEDEEEAALAAELRGGATSLTNRSSRCSGMSHRSNTAAGISHRSAGGGGGDASVFTGSCCSGWKWRGSPTKTGSAPSDGVPLYSLRSFITRGVWPK